ncbi:hypothetical protein [uncultured Porphyromonas sp.]|uniref:hypothetical protein n=1 Tax=uncultured Porphyromonas sp. TaxID=159274 RepID=UPI002603E1F1|nr:hypothetical protein [uncultured Porphyromonas sp.]
MNKMKATMGLVLILIVFAALRAEAQITMSLRVSWRIEVSPLDTLRQPINVPYLHVVYRNDSDTNYYLVRRDRPRWIFPYIGFTEDLLQYQENYDYVNRNEVRAMQFKIYLEQERVHKSHQVILGHSGWEIDQETSTSSHRSHSSDPQVDWSECVEYLQYILSCLRAPVRRDPHALKVYGQQDNLHSVAKEPYKTDGILRLLEGRLAFLPARSEREYTYSLLAFRMVRGRFHFVIPNRVAKDTTIDNEALGMEGDPSKGLSEVKLPRHYEGYQLYRGQVRGDSIWIEM